LHFSVHRLRANQQQFPQDRLCSIT